jgi:starch phosphorylase
LKKLDELTRNMWWAWNYEARDLFRSLDPEIYTAVGHNPVLLLQRIGYDRLEEMGKDPDIQAQVESVYKKFRKYMDVTPNAKRPSVAYFCMEYGLNQVVKIYSGGLGILAGDYIKEASDSNVDMCAVGLLYRYGYFTQTLSMDGQQIANYDVQDFNNLPIERVLDANGDPMVIDVPYINYTVHAYLWQINVGRVKLYLLDTDNEMNSEFDRPITHTLYGGDWENRIKQEILLGIGGVLALKKLGIKKDVYHCNEGHAALCNVQRLVDYVAQGLTFNQAMELVRASSLYTVHTPVPAGHDYFDEALFGKYMGSYPEKLGISWDEFIGMGRMNPEDHGERFCMSTFACNTCQEVNGVSWLHGEVSKQMFAPIWKGYYPEESHVGYVTNGVHFPTWAATEWRQLYSKHFDKNFMNDQSNEKIWEAIYNVSDEEIWATRQKLKNKLVDYIRKQFRESWLKNQGDPSRVVSLLDKINPNALIIGFGRRFATYKRAHLLFTDLDRLAKIVNNEKYPVQFLFTGKAHPADGAGQGLIRMIYEISQRPEFLGKIIFLENYDMQLSRRLISGVDIWMNTPTRPLEASGTSGEKAEMNGVINLSVKDGWWLEGYREGAGWALTEKRTYENQEHQDKLDAATIYTLLENEILPLYYARNSKGYSTGWIKVIKNSIAQIAPHYTMKRQLDDYYDRFYCKEAARFKELAKDDYKLAKELAAWKEEVVQRWDSIKVVSCNKEDALQRGQIDAGKKYDITYVVDEQGLDDAIGIELITLTTDKDGKEHIYRVDTMEMVKKEGNLHTFKLTHTIDNAGMFRVAYRMFPKHPLLPHRQDFCYVKWFL